MALRAEGSFENWNFANGIGMKIEEQAESSGRKKKLCTGTLRTPALTTQPTCIIHLFWE